MTYTATCSICGELGDYDDQGFAQSVADDHNSNNPGHQATVTAAQDPAAAQDPSTAPAAAADPSQTYDPSQYADPSHYTDPSQYIDVSPYIDAAQPSGFDDGSQYAAIHGADDYLNAEAHPQDQ